MTENVGADHSALLTVANRAYERYQDERHDIAREIRAEYKRKAEEAIETALAAEKRKVAEVIRDAVEAGVPGQLIRSEVLHTQDWGRWKMWRDLAGLEGDRARVRTARQEALNAEKPYRIEDGTVIVTKNARGPVEEFAIESVELVGGLPTFWPDLNDTGWQKDFPDGLPEVSEFVRKAFEKYGDNPEDLMKSDNEEESF